MSQILDLLIGDVVTQSTFVSIAYALRLSDKYGVSSDSKYNVYTPDFIFDEVFGDDFEHAVIEDMNIFRNLIQGKTIAYHFDGGILVIKTDNSKITGYEWEE